MSPPEKEVSLKQRETYLMKQYNILKNLRENDDKLMNKNNIELYELYKALDKEQKGLFYLEKAT